MLVSIHLACTFLPILLQHYQSSVLRFSKWSLLVRLPDQNYVCILYLPCMLHAPISLLKEMTSYICSCVGDRGPSIGDFQNYASNIFLRGNLELFCLHFVVGMLLILAACSFLSLYFVYYSYILI
jgi:hypothetical protein